MITRNKVSEELCLISQFEPKTVDEAYKHEHQIKDMKKELEMIKKNMTLGLVSIPNDKKIIGRKWELRNKINEQGEVVRNKESLVCKGYSQ